jgi:hypothetical protein
VLYWARIIAIGLAAGLKAAADAVEDDRGGFPIGQGKPPWD